MTRVILAVVGLLAIAGMAAAIMLWRNSAVQVFNGHVMGESNSAFAQIEAKLHGLDLDKCDYIARPEKRRLCDELVELINGKRDFVNVEDAQGQFQGTLTGVGANGDLTNARLTNVKLFRLLVSAGPYDSTVKDLTTKYGPPHMTGEHKISRFAQKGNRVAEWFVKPHTAIALEEDQYITYTYVDKSPWREQGDTPLPEVGKGEQHSMTPQSAVPSDGAHNVAGRQVDNPTTAATSPGPSAPQHLAEIIRVLHQPQGSREVPVPDKFWNDVGATSDVRGNTSAYALSLSNSTSPEVVWVDEDPNVCGSSGCPQSIYGLHTDVAPDGSIVHHYKPLLSGDNRGSIHVLNTTTNRYRDLLIDGSDGASVYKFNGNLYTEVECFSHEHNDSDSLQTTNCPR